jgi:parvulin-like peptidyl-prolyl isomerase
MYFKKFSLCAFCAFLRLFSLLLQAEVIAVDRIAAVVNDEIITQSDIDKAIRFYPVFRKKDESDRAFYISVLQDLINYKVICLEYRDEVTPRDEDYTEVETSIIKKVGSYDQLLRLLRRYDMQWRDFKAFIREKVVYEKVLNQKIRLKLTINFQEIQRFYNEQYLPQQRGLGLKPRTLIEMAPLIETKLRKDRIEQELAEWMKEIAASYKIENKLLKE